MAFNSLQYIVVFLPVAVVVANRLRGRSRVLWLLALSYVFYGAFDWRFLGLLAVSTIVDFTVGKTMAARVDPGVRKRLLWTSVAVNLSILGLFKYFGFFVDSAVAVGDAVGLQLQSSTLAIVLPAGISFYTFQTMAYTIDVYRRRIQPEEDLPVFALYVAFFPQLVAGPIERAGRLLPQLHHPMPRTAPDTLSAVALIVLGLVKKVVLADTAAGIVSVAFSTPGEQHWLMLVAGVYAFALQIYGDFSGYTDIARGSAALLGVDLMPNFSQPYLSRSITEFWRRWHISLSTWLRDYLYIPLGGNRQGTMATYRNLMITMLLGGLWHGAAWTFVVWGGLHGAFLAVHRMVSRSTVEEPVVRWRRDWWRILATFHLVCLGWIFFRAENFGDAAAVVRGLLTTQGGEMSVQVVILPVLIVLAVAIDLLQRRGWERAAFLGRLTPISRGGLIAAGVASIALFSGGPAVPFIYFRF